jgi:two-component system, OmpR family, phosphate regulon sensor histidine kinase PhoR
MTAVEEQIRRLETVRRDFVANVSHELRTPISVIRANAETLLEPDIDPVFRYKLVEAILRHSERLTSLVDDLLDLSRLEAGKQTLTYQQIYLKQAVERIVASHLQPASERHIEVRYEVAEFLSCRADARAVDQVLSNLLDNAIKYTPPGGRVLIRSFLCAGRSTVRLEVEDSGQGIDPNHQERIFERFYRVDSGRSRDVGGTGLGLSIVKHLVEAMHGNVGVQSALPHGSLFWVELAP